VSETRFQELARLRPQLASFAMLRLRNRALAEDAVQETLLAAIECNLTQLPSGAARVFVLRDGLGMDTEEVCRELAISVSNCGVMLHRAHIRPRQCPHLRGNAADAI
jgi:DNA-directed RNA polymerase specialized sigma24 family protein